VGEGINERRYFVAVDNDLNKLAFAPASTFAFLDKVKVVSLTQLDRLELLNGKEVTTTLMKGKDAGAKVKVRLDPVRKNLKVAGIASPQQAQQAPKVQQAQKAAQKQKAVMSNDLKQATMTIRQAATVVEQKPAKKMGV
jgi:hypothetical protein